MATADTAEALDVVSKQGIYRIIVNRINREPITTILLCVVLVFVGYSLLSVVPGLYREVQGNYKAYQEAQIAADARRDANMQHALTQLAEGFKEQSREQRQAYLDALKRSDEANAKQLELLRESIKGLQEALRAIDRAAAAIQGEHWLGKAFAEQGERDNSNTVAPVPSH